MKITVTGLESSGTKWITALLEKVPGIEKVIHTSIPENWAPNTHWPDLSGADFVVWVWRYEPFRARSVDAFQYNRDRTIRFVPPWLYSKCSRIYSKIQCPVIMVSYEGLIGPCGKLVFRNLLDRLGLDSKKVTWGNWNPKDANAKYLPG